jgi:hypothetical protein
VGDRVGKCCLRLVGCTALASLFQRLLHSIPMSHEDIALVWSVLYGREDVNSILLESIGSHSLDVSVHRGDPERLRKALLQHVMNLKVI